MAAPPQVEPVAPKRTPADGGAPPVPQAQPGAAPRGPLANIRTLQQTHGNYYVQRALTQYNAAHPLAKAPDARKPAPPAPAKPIPAANAHAKPAAVAAKVAPASGTTAVTSAIAKSPARLPQAPAASPGAAGKGGGPTLDQWKSRVHADAGKKLVAPAPKAAPEAAQKLDAEQQKKAAAKTDFAAEAQKKIPPPPKVEAPPAPVDTLAKSVHDAIGAVSDKRLTDQALPALTASPGHAGIKNPDGQFPAIGAPAVAKQDQAPPQPAAGTAPADAKDPAAKQEEEKKKQAGDAVSQADQQRKAVELFFGPQPPAPTVVRDTGAKPSLPIPEGAKGDIGESVALVLSKSPEEAKEMVGLAEKTAYPHAALAECAPEIAKDALAPEKTRLDAELHGIGAAAGIEAAALDQKAAEKAKLAAGQAASGDQAVADKAAGASAATQKKAAGDQKAIAAAKARNDDEIELKSEAAGTPPDPKLVNERQQRLLDSLDDQSSNARVGYRKALEDRGTALDKAAEDQIDAYRQTARAEADEIKALYPSDSDKAKAEAWPSLSWADRSAKSVRESVAVLKRDAGKEGKAFQDSVTEAQDKETLVIHEWADARLSRSRSFWEMLVALFTHWEHAAKADTEAWEKLRNQQTMDAMAGDLAAIDKVRQAAASQNADEMKAAIDGLDTEHQILLLKFFKAGGDSIMAVAGAMLGRIEQRRVPELAGEFRAKSLELSNWEALNKLAKSQNPNFDAWHLAGEVRASVKDWGTDEDRLFAAIKHHTPLEVKAIKLAYAERFRETDRGSADYGKGRDMAADIDDDLSGDEAARAKASLAGDSTGQDVFALHDALTGFWGADKAAIMDTLRGKSPLERDELLARYKDEFGIDLREHMDFTLDDRSKDQATALLAGETDRADAIGLQRALHSHVFGGAEITEVDAVYQQIRREVEAEAANRNMTTAEVEAEYKRRAAAVEGQWNQKYADGNPGGMKDAFKDRLSGGEKDLAVALAEDQHDAEDAARIRAESESVWYTSDKKVLGVLRKQRERAETEVRRDMMVRYRERAAAEHWSPEEAKRKFDEMNAQAEKDIDDRAEKNLKTLEKVYDKNYSNGWGPGALTAVVELEMSGNEEEEARLIRKNKGGKLSIAEEVHWATTGLGTDDELLRRALKGRSKAELDAARAEYREKYHAELDADVFDDVSGRDEFDYGLMLKGNPATPAEELDRMHAKREYELGSGSGIGSDLAVEESDSLQRTSDKAGLIYKSYQDAVKEHGEHSPEAESALARFREWSGYTDEAVTSLRAEVDSLTDHIAMAAALVVGAIVAIATAGAATPAVVAAISALAATAATVSVKLAMKGHAYGIEEYGTDVLMGAVDVAAAALTAGVGNALLRTNLLSRLAEDQFVTRVAKYGLAHAASGLVAGLPTGLVGQIVSADTWASDAPLKTALLGILKSEAVAGGMAVGFGSIEAVKGGHGTTGGAHEEGHVTSHETPVREQKPPVPDLETHAKQTVKVDPPSELESKLAAVAGSEVKMAGGGNKAGPPVQSSGAPAPQRPPGRGTVYVEPGSREYHALLHEGWTDRMLRDGLGPFEPGRAPTGPELPPGQFKTGIQTPEEAYAAYNEAMARAPGREVGIFRNLNTGEYVVRVGDETSVHFPPGTEPHEAVLHCHPNPDNVLTFRMPSGADISEAALASARLGRPVTQFVEHPIPGTTKRGRTAITVDAQTRKIRVEYVNGEGVRVKPLEFPNEVEYQKYYQSRKIVPDTRVMGEFIAETNRWLAGRRGLTPSWDDEDGAVRMAGKKKSAPAAAAPPRVPAFDFDPGAAPDRRTAGTGGIESIERKRDAMGVVNTTIEGELLPGMDRKNAAPNYNEQWHRAQIVGDLQPLFEARGDTPAVARAKAQAFADNYEAAHLWGPGFGDEAAAGMMWAPIEVNQEMQNQFAEKFGRSLRDAANQAGGKVRVKATGVPFDRATLKAQGLPPNMNFLEHVQYDITLERPGAEPRTVRMTVSAGYPGATARGGIHFDPPEAAYRFLEAFGLK